MSFSRRAEQVGRSVQQASLPLEILANSYDPVKKSISDSNKLRTMIGLHNASKIKSDITQSPPSHCTPSSWERHSENRTWHHLVIFLPLYGIIRGVEGKDRWTNGDAIPSHCINLLGGGEEGTAWTIVNGHYPARLLSRIRQHPQKLLQVLPSHLSIFILNHKTPLMPNCNVSCPTFIQWTSCQKLWVIYAIGPGEKEEDNQIPEAFQSLA